MELQKAFDRVIQSEGEAIFRFVKSRLNKELQISLEAQDILNQAIAHALQRQERFKNSSDEDLVKYLYWKTARLLIDHHRLLKREFKRRRHLALSQKDASQGQGIEPSPTALIHKSRKRDAVFKMVEQISDPQCRQAVELVFLFRKKPAMAASIMGENITEFRKLFQRGFRELIKHARQSKVQVYLTTGSTS